MIQMKYTLVYISFISKLEHRCYNLKKIKVLCPRFDILRLYIKDVQLIDQPYFTNKVNFSKTKDYCLS
jgi:hypothetical protein